MKYILWLIVTVLGVTNMAWATNILDRLTQDDQDVVVTNDIVDPLRDWAHNPGSRVDWMYYQWGITTFFQAQNQTLRFIQNLVNWALMFLWVVALVYLIYHGFLMITAAWDEAQFKKWAKALRSAIVAIVWIALSAIIVNFIFYIVGRFI